jgi:hypothetical protein
LLWVFNAAWCLKFSSISITRRRQLIPMNRYLLDITRYFELIQSFNFPLSVGTFIAMVCKNHRGGNQAIKKQLNWRGYYSHETGNPDRVQPQSFMGQSFAGKDMQYLVVDSNFANYRFLGSNYSNSPLCRSEILLHSYGFIQGQEKRYQGRSGSATKRLSFGGQRRTSAKQGILVSYLCRSNLILAASQTTKLGIEEK